MNLRHYLPCRSWLYTLPQQMSRQTLAAGSRHASCGPFCRNRGHMLHSVSLQGQAWKTASAERFATAAAAPCWVPHSMHQDQQQPAATCLARWLGLSTVPSTVWLLYSPPHGGQRCPGFLVKLLPRLQQVESPIAACLCGAAGESPAAWAAGCLLRSGVQSTYAWPRVWTSGKRRGSLRSLGATASESSPRQDFVIPCWQLEKLSVDVQGLAWTAPPEDSLHLPHLSSLSVAPGSNSCASLVAANTRLRAVCLSPALQQHEAGAHCGQTAVP